MIDVNSHIRTLGLYTPGASPERIREEYGLTSVQKLASNENPRGASTLATDAAVEAIRGVHLYGDGGLVLRNELAAFHGVTSDMISVHNGSDAIIHQIMKTFLLPGETALSSHGTFVSFSLATAAAGRDSKTVPMAAGYRYDVQALAAAIDSSTKVLYIANPNNPTGTFVTSDELEWLLTVVPSRVLVVIDEAYVEYAQREVSSQYPNVLAWSKPNVLQLRTFSKAYGMAGLRIGYAVGHPDVITWLHRTKLPFDPNAIGCAAAIAALQDQEFVSQTVELNHYGLQLLQNTLADVQAECSQSVANFVMIDCGSEHAAADLHRGLLRDGFITRPLAGFGLPTCLRITTGTTAQNSAVSDALRKRLHKEHVSGV